MQRKVTQQCLVGEQTHVFLALMKILQYWLLSDLAGDEK